jgi:predicted HAD superfamily Cof-like phosphohydrolase
MSIDWFGDVLNFHKTLGIIVGEKPSIPDKNILDLRLKIETEERDEMLEAVEINDLPGYADAIVDQIYVLIGRAVSSGIDLRPLWDEVQRANMAKVGGPVRSDGKQLKPKNWIGPDISGVLSKQEPIK